MGALIKNFLYRCLPEHFIIKIPRSLYSYKPLLHDFKWDVAGSDEGGHFEQGRNFLSLRVGRTEKDVIQATFRIARRGEERSGAPVVEGRRR